MKHLLNNLSEEEKNSIREQHEGRMKMKVTNENFHKMVNKKLGHVDLYLNEQQSTKVLGPFKHQNLVRDARFDSNTVYVVKLDRDACMAGPSGLDGTRPDRGTLYEPTNGKCTYDKDTLLPGNKYYVSSQFGKRMLMPVKIGHSETFMLSTNGEQGYNTPEEAKEAISNMINPRGEKGRQVSNYTDDEGNKIKSVDKYNRKGDLKKVKEKLTTTSGEVSKTKKGTGL